MVMISPMLKSVWEHISLFAKFIFVSAMFIKCWFTLHLWYDKPHTLQRRKSTLWTAQLLQQNTRSKDDPKLKIPFIICLLGQDETQTGLTCALMSYYPDSVPIGIDTLSTYCMTNDLGDFQGTPESCTCSVLGVNNNTAVISKRGTGSYKILDQNGMSHTWIIPDLYYCATTPYRVISP